MNQGEIIYTLNGRLGRNKIYFDGVKTADLVKNYRIPNLIDRPIAFISNILRRNDARIGHWVVFLISQYPKKCIFFYDSFGLSPELYSKDFFYFLDKHKAYELQCFNRVLQAPTSLFCGLYCCHFIYLLSWYGLNTTVFILNNYFSSNLSSNDKKVYDFYHKRLNARRCDYWKNKRETVVTYEQCLKHLRLS